MISLFSGGRAAAENPKPVLKTPNLLVSGPTNGFHGLFFSVLIKLKEQCVTTVWQFENVEKDPNSYSNWCLVTCKISETPCRLMWKFESYAQLFAT